MAQNVTLADIYISANCIDIEDWTDSDAAKKQRTLNVAERTLTVTYPKYTIPDAAVYEFANVLAIIFNDTNRLATHGLTSFSVDKVGSFNFKDNRVGSPNGDLARFIPQTSRDLIGAENGVKLGSRRVGWTVL
ncbi:hypothetical protein [Cohnella silvisoli]|uniref:Uncharacterized protein n=1 Tax=Cohnella silvisoli TaxID=2873699 RepID=A0ABV1KYY7_9BACL|nr:hypothetical protein [Cohnella silvisoli]MCD9024319.1 hypothetical protein [Cohnella silvisoli]